MDIPNPIKTMVIDKLVKEPDLMRDEGKYILLTYGTDLKIKIYPHKITVEEVDSTEDVSFEDVDFVNMIIQLNTMGISS